MPAYASEVHEAEMEGVGFVFLASPVEIVGGADGHVRAVRCERMALGEPDASGRARPVPTGEQLDVEADLVITALGTRPEAWIADAIGEPGMHVGGDAMRGPATVVEAIGDGLRAADAIDRADMNGIR